MDNLEDQNNSTKLIKDFCNEADYKSAAHLIRIIGALHGTNTMLLYMIHIITSLTFEHQIGLADEFRSQIK